ncbi:MAG: hypothetical protein JWN36_1221 [Microbacteriaceae bacterium]|nr:hypothetical protein [Microbacteriaceae bacterium]
MRLSALLLSLATATGLLVAPMAAAAEVAAPAKPVARVEFAPTVGGTLQPGNALVVTGTITNESTAELAAGTATVYLDRNPITSRDTLSDWIDGTDDVATSKLGSQLVSVDTPAVLPGRTATLTITVPEPNIGLSASAGWGAHTLAVEYTVSGAAVAQSRSSLVWYPGGAVSTVSLAFVYPLTVPAGTTGLIPADVLTTYTAPDGLLTRELEQVIDRRSVAIALDPMILASINVLGTSAPQSAVDWLKQLNTLTNESFPLTYADSDVAAERQAGVTTLLAPTSFPIDPKLFPGHTAPPTTTPTVTPTPNPTSTPAPALPTPATLVDFTYTPALAKLVWPTDGTVVEADLDALKGYGFDRAILSSSNVSFGDLDHTPSAATTASGHDSLVSDSQISRLLSAAASATDDVSWQKDVAELSSAIAVVSKQRGGGDRSLLAEFARGQPGDYLRLAQTLQVLGQQPWAGFSQVTDLLAQSPATATVTGKGESAERISTVRSLLASEASVDSFSSILADPTVLTGERRLSLLALLANSWNSQLPAWNTAAKKYVASSNKTLGSVKIVKPGSIFVPAESVPLGVAVTNGLQWPITVNVSLVSPSSVIEVEKTDIPLTVEANSQGKASVPVKAVANGQVTVQASLTSATGVAIGAPVGIDLNVQAGWETALTAVIAAVLAIIFGVGIYRNIRKRRRQNREGGPDDEDAEPEAAAAE